MSEEQLFYIISLKHTSKADMALTFWCSNGAGYCWDKSRAGLYTKSEAAKHTNEETIAVEKEKVDPFWMNAIDFNDKYVSVPNTPTTRYRFGLDQKFMKAKKYSNCRMTFLNTPFP